MRVFTREAPSRSEALRRPTGKESMPSKSPVKYRRHLRLGLEGLSMNSMRAESVEVILLPLSLSGSTGLCV
jgi:hypothetical protein